MQTPFSAPGRCGLGASSNVKVPGAGGDVRRNWQAISQLASAVAGQAGASADLQSKLANLKMIARRLDELHPFKLYQIPSVLRVTPDPATDWRKFLVRAGRVMETDASGTDAVDSDPDSEIYPAAPVEITMPENTSKFWFWLEIGSGGTTTAVVRYGPDPTAASYGSVWTSTNPWTGAPVPDAQHIPIGWVDTNTHKDELRATVRQLLRADLVGGTGISPCPQA